MHESLKRARPTAIHNDVSESAKHRWSFCINTQLRSIDNFARASYITLMLFKFTIKFVSEFGRFLTMENFQPISASRKHGNFFQIQHMWHIVIAFDYMILIALWLSKRIECRTLQNILDVTRNRAHCFATEADGSNGALLHKTYNSRAFNTVIILQNVTNCLINIDEFTQLFLCWRNVPFATSTVPAIALFPSTPDK